MAQGRLCLLQYRTCRSTARDEGASSSSRTVQLSQKSHYQKHMHQPGVFWDAYVSAMEVNFGPASLFAGLWSFVPDGLLLSFGLYVSSSLWSPLFGIAMACVFPCAGS